MSLAFLIVGLRPRPTRRSIPSTPWCSSTLIASPPSTVANSLTAASRWSWRRSTRPSMTPSKSWRTSHGPERKTTPAIRGAQHGAHHDHGNHPPLLRHRRRPGHGHGRPPERDVPARASGVDLLLLY